MSNKIKKGLFHFLITLCTGYFGVHKFLNGQIGLGIAYFFTGGFFGIGWLYDTIVSGIDLYHLYEEERSYSSIEAYSYEYIPRQQDYKENLQGQSSGDPTAQKIACTLMQYLNQKRGCQVSLIDAQATPEGFDFIMEASSPEEAHHILSFETEFNEILKDEFHFTYLYRSQFLIRLILH